MARPAINTKPNRAQLWDSHPGASASKLTSESMPQR